MQNRYRVISLLLFLLALIGLNYGLNKTLEIPVGNKGIWFHAGLLLIILGSYWTEYYFTKPSDVVINGLLALISITTLENPPFQFWWTVLRYYSLTLIIIAFLIVWHGSPSIPSRPSGVLKKIFYQLIIRLGNSKVVFSLVFFLSVVSFFKMDSPEAKWMLGFWTFVIIIKSLEVDDIVKYIINILKNNKDGEHIGVVTQFIQPGIARFQLDENLSCVPDSLVAFTRTDTISPDDPIGVITTNRISPTSTKCEAILLKNFCDNSVNNRKNVIKITKPDKSLLESLSKNSIFQRLKYLIGYSVNLTDIGTLKFEFIKRPDIEEGHLVAASISNSKDVLYQIVNGQHFEEKTDETSERRFTLGTAEQLGTWSKDKQCFETYSWVVRENSPVFHITPDTVVEKKSQEKIQDVGFVPNSNFPVNINLTDLTLYHSAILGVTGSGKSYLAYHLMESLAKSGVKILCLDITGDHRRHMKDACLVKLPSLIEPFLDSTKYKIGIIEFQDKSHPIESTLKIAQIANSWCQKHRRDEEIKQPIPKVLIVLEEAHTLIPEWNFNPEKEKQGIVNQISQVVLQARKFGLGFMIITQRTANVTKSILNQCNTIFSFQAYDETGFDFMKNYMGEGYVRALPNLKQRHGVIVGKASLSDRPLIARFHDQNRGLNESIPEFQVTTQQSSS